MAKCSAWQKHQTQKKWQSIVAVFIVIILGFAILNGAIKSVKLSKNFSSPKWDGQSSFVAVISKKPFSLFIFQKDPKRIGIFSVDNKLSFITGGVEEPVKSLQDVLDQSEIIKAASLTFGTSVDHLAVVDVGEINEDISQELFKKYASIVTPFKILTTGWGSGEENTNITRIDALRLWWQVKGLRINDVNFKDLSLHTQEIVGEDKKVLGVDTVSVNREIGDYIQNVKVTQENFDVELVNASGSSFALDTASSFVSTIGAKVVRIENTKEFQDKTMVFAKSDSYTAVYLAKIFDCDINDRLEDENGREIKIVIGRDFVEKYFE